MPAVSFADQRIYASGYGRFNSADPYAASVGPSRPSSWNRYAYVEGDPINHRDTRGLCTEDLNGDFWDDASEVFLLLNFDEQEYTPGACSGDATYEAELATFGATLNGVFMPAQNEGNGSGTSTAPPAPTCDVEEQDTGVIAGKVHTYLDVTDASDNSSVIEGIQSSVMKSVIPGLTYL